MPTCSGFEIEICYINAKALGKFVNGPCLCVLMWKMKILRRSFSEIWCEDWLNSLMPSAYRALTHDEAKSSLQVDG